MLFAELGEVAKCRLRALGLASDIEAQIPKLRVARGLGGHLGQTARHARVTLHRSVCFPGIVCVRRTRFSGSPGAAGNSTPRRVRRNLRIWLEWAMPRDLRMTSARVLSPPLSSWRSSSQ